VYPLAAAVRDPTAYDVLAVLLVFLAFLSPAITVILWKEVRVWKERRRRDQAEADALRTEGFPPPGPPTTDSLSEE